MFRKLRRFWAHKTIKKFLEKYLPEIELGEVKEFKCKNFQLGSYVVTTDKGKYELHFWELIDSAKEFYLQLVKSEKNDERLCFSIIGNITFKIMPCEFVIDREVNRQVVKLQTGLARIYMLGAKADEVDYNYIEYKRPIVNSECIDMERVLRISPNYIYNK